MTFIPTSKEGGFSSNQCNKGVRVVEIEKETAKQLKLKDNTYYKTIARKDELERPHYGYERETDVVAVSLDKDIAIKLWNEYLDRRIAEMEEKLARVKDMRIL